MNRDGLSFETVHARGILTELLKNSWMILAFALSVCLGAIGVGRLLYTPQYTVSSTVVVGVRGSTDTYSNLSTATQMADVIGEVFESDAMLELIQEDTKDSISANIVCRQVQETNLLTLEAVADNPREAYLFLSAALEHYDEVSEYVFANATLQVLQEPSVPTAPSNHPRFSTRPVELLILGAGFMAFVIVLLYVARHTVKNSAYAERLLDGNVLGVIPYERKSLRSGGKKAKTALLLSSPVVTMNYAEASRKAQARLEHYLRKEKKKTVLISSISENEGKSTVAANLALSLAEKRKKVLLVDGDFIKPAQYKIFDRTESAGNPLADVLREKTALEDALVFLEETGIYQLFLYRAVSQPSRFLDVEKLKLLLQSLEEQMDYIIIDTSPTAASTDAELWMQAVDAAVLVVREDWSDVRVINDTVDVIWQSGCGFVGFILNGFQKNSGTNYGYGNYQER